MNKASSIFVAGHNGLVGSATVRYLKKIGYENIITRSRNELDLLNQQSVLNFFKENKPEYVILAAAKVGGIYANQTYPADFIYDNLVIQSNVINAAYQFGATRLVFLGSSCIYPKLCPQPIKEEYLLSGELEATNEPYAIAKIAGLKMCSAFAQQYGFSAVTLMPTNMYGPNDNFDLETSHVLPAMLRKFHEAKLHELSKVILWGDGSPYREFLHVDDLASAIEFMLHRDETEMFNVGVGIDITIYDLAQKIKSIVGYNGKIEWDKTKPNGTPRKLLNVDKMRNLGWQSEISIDEGIETTYQWCLNNHPAFSR